MALRHRAPPHPHRRRRSASRQQRRRRRAATGQKTRPTKFPRRLSRTRAGDWPGVRYPLDAGTARRAAFAFFDRAASTGCPAARSGWVRRRPAGPTADAGPHAAGPARRLALLQPYGNLSARSRARLQPADVLLRPPAGEKVPAGGAAAADGRQGSCAWLLKVAARGAQGAQPGGDKGKSGRRGHGAAAPILVGRHHGQVTARAAGARRPHGGGFGRIHGRCGGLFGRLATLCAAAEPPRGRGNGRAGPARGAAGARGGGRRRARRGGGRRGGAAEEPRKSEKN